MIYLGKLLTKDDLPIFFFNTDGITATDPFYVSYTIFDLTKENQCVIRQTINSKPMCFDVGSYFVPIHLDPKIFRPGKYAIKWSYKKFIDSNLLSTVNTFDIVTPTKYGGEFCRSTYAKDKTIM